jgi:hypothetical protein
MATIDIGKIKPVFKGTYDNSTAYVLDDIVYYNGSSYVAKTSTTGNLPTDTTKWNILAQGSGGIFDSTLALGTAGKILHVNSGATALEFTDAPAGGLVQVVQGTFDSTASTSSHNTMVDSGLTVNITPASTSNKVLCFFNINLQPDGGQYSGGISIVRGSTAIRTGSTGNNRGTAQMWSPSDNYHMNHFTGMVLDSPNTTSATTYKVQFASGYSGQTVYINRGWGNNNHFDSTSTIICMEIAV